MTETNHRWQTPPPELFLRENEIHVWRASLDLPSRVVQRLYPTLSIDERLRVKRFHFEKDRKQYVARRGILREILARYLGVESIKVQFLYGKNGKPSLADTLGKETVFFNISHSDGLALYAFSRDRELGVDIEHIRDIPEIDQIVARFFSAKENVAYQSLPGRMRKEGFFNCWTRKEAVMKAIGDGLYIPLDRFEVSLVPGEPANLISIGGDSKAALRWSILDLRPFSRFAAALAVLGQSYQPHCWQWSF